MKRINRLMSFAIATCVAIGISAALRASSFEEALIIAANHDGDSDSTASIAGQIYGAWHGDGVLPS